MKSKAILASVLVLPLMLLACNRADHSPAPSTGTSQEKKEAPPASSPGAQTPSGGAMSPSTTPPADSAVSPNPPSEEKKN